MQYQLPPPILCGHIHRTSPDGEIFSAQATLWTQNLSLLVVNAISTTKRQRTEGHAATQLEHPSHCHTTITPTPFVHFVERRDRHPLPTDHQNWTYCLYCKSMTMCSTSSTIEEFRHHQHHVYIALSANCPDTRKHVALSRHTENDLHPPHCRDDRKK